MAFCCIPCMGTVYFIHAIHPLAIIIGDPSAQWGQDKNNITIKRRRKVRHIFDIYFIKVNIC